MFKKIQDGSFILSSYVKKYKWFYGTAEERAKIANDAIEKGHDDELSFVSDLIKAPTDDDSEEIVLPAGIYKLHPASYGSPEKLVNIKIQNRNYSHFPEIFNQLDKEIDWFINNKNFFSSIGIRRSRSVLLWGPPGYSKTAKIHDLIQKMKNVIVIFMSRTPSDAMVESLNKINMDKIVIFEEFATAVNNDTKISEMLNFLDGDNSLDNSFFIITTNHPEVIPKNILRPSRVDRFIKIDKLSDNDIEHFLKFYLKREVSEEEIDSMKKQSLANLKEICISSLKESLTLDEAIKLLKSREELLKKDFASERKISLRDDDDY
jgi:ATP-dependent Zn protease